MCVYFVASRGLCFESVAECCAIFDKDSKRNASVTFASQVSRDPQFQLYPRESRSVRKIAHLIRLAVYIVEIGGSDMRAMMVSRGALVLAGECNKF